MHFDEASDQREADAEAALGTVKRAVALHEEVEYAREQVFGDSNAGVADVDSDLVAFANGIQPNTAAGIGVLSGVIEQIGEDLLQPRGVGHQAHGVVGKRDGELVLPSGDQRIDSGHCAADGPLQLDRFLTKLDLAARDARNVEQVIDEARHHLHLPSENLARGRTRARRSGQR